MAWTRPLSGKSHLVSSSLSYSALLYWQDNLICSTKICQLLSDWPRLPKESSRIKQCLRGRARLLSQAAAGNKPFAQFGQMVWNMVWNKLCWDAINTVGLPRQNKGTLTSPAQCSFVFKVPLHYLRPSITYYHVTRPCKGPIKPIAKISVTSPIVINMPTSELLAGETKSSFV